MIERDKKQATHEEIIQALGTTISPVSPVPAHRSVSPALIAGIVTGVVIIVFLVIAFGMPSGDDQASYTSEEVASNYQENEVALPLDFTNYFASGESEKAESLIHEDSALLTSVDLMSTVNNFVGVGVDWPTCKEIKLKEFRTGTYKTSMKTRTAIYVPLLCSRQDGTQVEIEFDLQKSISGDLRIFDIIARLL